MRHTEVPPTSTYASCVPRGTALNARTSSGSLLARAWPFVTPQQAPSAPREASKSGHEKGL